ncbi:hypothetical protein OPV22_030889 [Ensete ventricosum]|uniref:Uncharacterized protein n=1 Tax=Ensete ventricosum TaxID=4639 RepID=A0AAV8PNE2_ENSVE|nr:hypothetical protein OPV22_030889 [Ensete ventricosum]
MDVTPPSPRCQLPSLAAAVTLHNYILSFAISEEVDLLFSTIPLRPVGGRRRGQRRSQKCGNLRIESSRFTPDIPSLSDPIRRAYFFFFSAAHRVLGGGGGGGRGPDKASSGCSLSGFGARGCVIADLGNTCCV